MEYGIFVRNGRLDERPSSVSPRTRTRPPWKTNGIKWWLPYLTTSASTVWSHCHLLLRFQHSTSPQVDCRNVTHFLRQLPSPCRHKGRQALEYGSNLVVQNICRVGIINHPHKSAMMINKYKDLSDVEWNERERMYTPNNPLEDYQCGILETQKTEHQSVSPKTLDRKQTLEFPEWIQTNSRWGIRRNPRAIQRDTEGKLKIC